MSNQASPETAANHVATILTLKDGEPMPAKIDKYYKDRIETARPEDLSDAAYAHFKLLYEGRKATGSLQFDFHQKETAFRFKKEEVALQGEAAVKVAEANALGFAFQAMAAQQNSYLSKIGEILQKGYDTAHNNPLLQASVNLLVALLEKQETSRLNVINENKELRAELKAQRGEEKKSHIQGLNMLTRQQQREAYVAGLEAELEALANGDFSIADEQARPEDETEKEMEQGAFGAIKSLFQQIAQVKEVAETLGIDIDFVKKLFKKKAPKPKEEEAKKADEQVNNEDSEIITPVK